MLVVLMCLYKVELCFMATGVYMRSASFCNLWQEFDPPVGIYAKLTGLLPKKMGVVFASR